MLNVLLVLYDLGKLFVVIVLHLTVLFFFFFNDTAPPEIYPLPLPDALPISCSPGRAMPGPGGQPHPTVATAASGTTPPQPPAQPAYSASVTAVGSSWRWRLRYRSEEHTSELQSQSNLVCRLLLEKKKKNISVGIVRPLYRAIRAGEGFGLDGPGARRQVSGPRALISCTVPSRLCLLADRIRDYSRTACSAFASS